MQTELADQITEYIETSAPAISIAELAVRKAAPTRPVRLALRQRRPMPRSAVAGAAAVAVAGGAVAAVIVTQQTGGARSPVAERPGVRPEHAHQSYARLAAAVVDHMQRASKAALAPAGHVFVRYADVDEGMPDGSGTLDITFSGQNYNSVSWQPTSKIGTWTDRVVDGQIYEYGELAPGQRRQWYHSTSETSAGQAVPDPRVLLQALEPAAGFELLGHSEIGGVRCEQLRATHVGGLGPSLASLGLSSEPLTGLDVWVDGSGVVRQMTMTFSGYDQQSNFSIEKQTVDFLDIGKAETITAPAHYVNQVTHG